MDTLLTLKPIELIDVGIDKLTKLPVPILNDNIVSNWEYDGFNLPIDYIIIEFDGSKDFNCYISAKIPITLTFNWGDDSNSQNYSFNPYNTVPIKQYLESGIYTINIIGPVSLITELKIGSGVRSIYLKDCKNLQSLDLSNNYLTTIDLDGLINLYHIDVSNNDIVDVDYDIYITADTVPISILNASKYLINTYGNSLPTIYSKENRDSLYYKGWNGNPSLVP